MYSFQKDYAEDVWASLSCNWNTPFCKVLVWHMWVWKTVPNEISRWMVIYSEPPCKRWGENIIRCVPVISLPSHSDSAGWWAVQPFKLWVAGDCCSAPNPGFVLFYWHSYKTQVFCSSRSCMLVRSCLFVFGSFVLKCCCLIFSVVVWIKLLQCQPSVMDRLWENDSANLLCCCGAELLIEGEKIRCVKTSEWSGTSALDHVQILIMFWLLELDHLWKKFC